VHPYIAEIMPESRLHFMAGAGVERFAGTPGAQASDRAVSCGPLEGEDIFVRTGNLAPSVRTLRGF
jgi:hypothetical protein